MNFASFLSRECRSGAPAVVRQRRCRLDFAGRLVSRRQMVAVRLNRRDRTAQIGDRRPGWIPPGPQIRGLARADATFFSADGKYLAFDLPAGEVPSSAMCSCCD
jgi:hypothetical protein